MAASYAGPPARLYSLPTPQKRLTEVCRGVLEGYLWKSADAPTLLLQVPIKLQRLLHPGGCQRPHPKSIIALSRSIDADETLMQPQKQLYLTQISWNGLEGCVQRCKEGEGVLNADLGAAAERRGQKGQVRIALQVALQPCLAARVAGRRRWGSQGGSGSCRTLGCRCGSLAGPSCGQDHGGWGRRAQAGPGCGQKGHRGWGWRAQAGCSCKCWQVCSWRGGGCGLCRHSPGLCQTLPLHAGRPLNQGAGWCKFCI